MAVTSYTWRNLASVVDLVGPKGYVHGWIFVGIPGAGQEVYHPQHGHGTVTASGGGRVQVSFDAGHSKTFPVRAHQGPGHFEQMTDDELAAEYNRSEGSRANAIISELDRRDQRDAEQKARRVSALYAEKPKTEADRSRVYQSLTGEGEDPEEAWAHAYGADPEAMRKQSVVQDLRSQGYKGSGFDALTRDAFKDEIRRRTVSAEGATNGYMLGPAGKKAGIDPWSLFTGPESRARKYASPELKEWWDQNGRPTITDFQAQLMGRKAGMKPADFYASVTPGDLAAVELAARSVKEGTVTATAVKPKAGAARSKLAPGSSPVSRGAAPAGQRQVSASLAAAPSRRPKVTPLAPKRREVAKMMRKLASQVQESHPDLIVHDHLRDAARTLESGNEEGAQRHLRAAIGKLAPQQLMKNGMHTDELHIAARQVMDSAHRHLLLVRDIADVAARNQEQLQKDSYGDDATSGPPPAVRADPNAGYGPGALAQKPTARQPPGNQALNAPGKSDGGGSDPAVADPNGPQKPGSKQFSYGWADVIRAIDLSARTAMLEATPAPIGKPGGPGLYRVKGLGHAAYFTQVRNGLMKRGIPEGKAHAMTWGILRRWAAGGGGVHPEVRAAAVKALAEEKAKGAAAKASHGHAVSWGDLDAVLEMAATAPPPASTAPASQSGGGSGSPQARVPVGQPGGGRFGSGGGQAPAGKQAAAKPDAHQKHLAHVAHMKQVAAAKAALLATAKDDQAKAAALIQQRNALQKALASAGGKVSSGQAGAKTATTAKTKSTAPATAKTASTSTTSAAPATAKAPAKTAAAKAATAPPGTAAAKATAVQLTQQIAALNSQINQLLAAAKQATAQAAALK
jgi:hypothetical protein